ncbi:uncharacterized protein HMPREF1541_07583 [Cyphellophora europaea CBS 101466]|uniref:SET domain-containing protein n=1 Tax=Cyphellophora europaea (strain CBS 101466) TaxID=1220924 RepID=W2RNR5_CYPE1|nr:uncharacterized protein HMPREF1541_07583 [Cyphellophora europaea CBS 101466]ETN37960.1 hypothetical protein HMPREF1541_07583 [Cyphellophora europaea CBS 101466]
MSKPRYPLSANQLESLVEYVPSTGEPFSIISKVSSPAGSVLTPITSATKTDIKAYSSVQVSRTQHVELNSALLYMNHSCAPSVEVDTSKMEVRVSRHRDLRAGDHVTFFYPSSEWDMARPFDCECKSEGCLKLISGASNMDMHMLRERGYFLNKHILELVEERGELRN